MNREREMPYTPAPLNQPVVGAVRGAETKLGQEMMKRMPKGK